MKQRRKQYGRKRTKRDAGQRIENGTKEKLRENSGRGTEDTSEKELKRKTGSTSEKRTGTGSARHARDVNSKEIFKNEKLVCQFLRDYTGISIFSDIRPEDIEDVTAKYHAYLGVEFETDIVKRVRVHIGDEQREVYVIPLIEHKSYVDYDVQMQLLRYMSVIWYDYGRQQNKLAGYSITGRKGFRYPLIIPIVYYEGAENWTADASLWKRVELGEEMRAYIPDFSYKVVRIHDYTSAEIQGHGNEMSLMLMLNRIQSPEDYTEFIKTSKAYMTSVISEAPPEFMDILLDVFWALLMKMNVPEEEAEELVENLGVKNMGYLFENAEKMDIQAERRNTREAREWAEAEKARAEAEKARAEAAEYSFRIILGTLVGLCRNEGLTKEETRIRLHDFYRVSETDLNKYFEICWQSD